jgi:Flp pilus assembly protein TadD
MSGATANETAAKTETPEQALARAQAAVQAKRFGEAAGICNDVLATTPDTPAALALLGVISTHTNDPERGISLLERALSARPGVASWYANLSALYRMVHRMQDARRVGHEAIRLDPNNADHLVDLSLVLTDLDDHEQAITCLLRAIGLRPNHADGHLALGQNLLAIGDFDAGWREYEWRNFTEAAKGTLPKMTSAAWNGMRIPNGRLLMVGDQGFGDSIQFARYIPLIADRCEELVLGCSAELGSLLAAIPGVAQCCHRWTDVPGHAAHCRLSSLPGLLHTTLETIPAKVPYLFADPSMVATWRERFGASLAPETRRIGLAWAGRPTHPNNRRRSLDLRRLAATGER